MEIPQAYRLHRCNACSGDALQEGAQVGTEHNERSASEQAEGRSPDGNGRCSPYLAGPFAAADCTFRPPDDVLFQGFGHLLYRQFASLRDNASSALSGIVSCFMFGSI